MIRNAIFEIEPHLSGRLDVAPSAIDSADQRRWFCNYDGTATLSDYRAYIIGIDGHRFVRVAQFSTDHPDDATAMKAAEELVDRHDIELWHSSRLVARFTPAQLDRVGKALIDTLQTFGNECVIREVKVERKDSA